MLPTLYRLAAANPRTTQHTYYGADLRQGPSLIRARRPFIVKNALTGMAILAFTASVYIYTIRAVAQDNFEDVKVPEAPTTGSGKQTTSSPLAK